MRFPRRLFVLLGLTSLLLSGGIALALHDVNTLDISRPWGGADQTAVSPTPRVEVTYVIKASGNIPADTVDAVEDAITAWNAKIDDREGGNWVFDLVPLAESSSSSSSSSAAAELILLGHNIKAPPDHGGGGGGDDGDKKADIEIQIKKGGGVIAGSAQSSFDADGFRVHVKIQISSSSFGIGNSDAVVEEIAMHELGHALSLGHHGDENDLMGRTVGFVGDGPSACDLDGFETSHHWLVEGATVPHLNHDSVIPC